MEIAYIKKNVYGNELRYINDENQAELLRKLTGHKTISEAQMAIISELFGVKFIQVLA